MGWGGQDLRMSLVRNRECMFCHTDLAFTEDHPVNLAFMDHIAAVPRCDDEFQQWTLNMDTDFKGD